MSGPTLKQRLAYERAMWKGLRSCLRAGHHTMSTAQFGHQYCWTCFHKYYYTEKPLLWRVRNLLGYLASSDVHYWR